MRCVRSYLNGVVAEIRWAERLSEWNHVPHFPYFVTHCVDGIPIASIGGILCDVLFNQKYANCVYKVTVAIHSLGNIIWICPLAPGTSAYVLIGDREGPKRSEGCCMDYEIGSVDALAQTTPCPRPCANNTWRCFCSCPWMLWSHLPQLNVACWLGMESAWFGDHLGCLCCGDPQMVHCWQLVLIISP